MGTSGKTCNVNKGMGWRSPLGCNSGTMVPHYALWKGFCTLPSMINKFKESSTLYKNRLNQKLGMMGLLIHIDHWIDSTSWKLVPRACKAFSTNFSVLIGINSMDKNFLKLVYPKIHAPNSAWLIRNVQKWNVCDISICFAEWLITTDTVRGFFYCFNLLSGFQLTIPWRGNITLAWGIEARWAYR